MTLDELNNREKFLNHLKKQHEEVEKWPKWKVDSFALYRSTVNVNGKLN